MSMMAGKAAEAIASKLGRDLKFVSRNEELTWYEMVVPSELLGLEYTEKIKGLNDVFMPKGMLAHTFIRGLLLTVVIVEFLDDNGRDPFKHGIPIKRRQMLKHPHHLAFMHNVPESVCFITFTRSFIAVRRQTRARTSGFHVSIGNASVKLKVITTVGEKVTLLIDGESPLELVFPNGDEASFFHDHVAHAIQKRLKADKVA